MRVRSDRILEDELANVTRFVALTNGVELIQNGKTIFVSGESINEFCRNLEEFAAMEGVS